MGLDHGLTKRHYVKNWDHFKPEARYQVTVLKGGKPDPNIKTNRITNVEEEVITWRKSNQIHRWFVENVQDGKDDCQEYSVDRAQIVKLLETCKEVVAGSELVPGAVTIGYTFESGSGREVAMQEAGKIINNTSVAERLLPTQSGFFFGSVDYDEWYLGDLKETISVLEEELRTSKSSDHYEYWSSW
jgi:hypothetical protein